MNPFITIKELKEKLDRKEMSPQEVMLFYAERIKKHNISLNSILEVFGDVVNDTKNSHNPSQPLSSIPCVLKDNICQKGRLTTASSKILSNYHAAYDATVTTRLKDAGARSIGRANCDEFAMGSSGEYSTYGPTKNPWNLEYVSGGSSSGPAAAVAAGLVPFALGTETGGSVRTPASFCNLVGLYPTYGLNSRYGVIALASSTDQVGPLTRTVYDNALVLSALAGTDPHDATSLQIPAQDYTKGLDGTLPHNLTIGVIRDALEADGINNEVRSTFIAATEHLKKMGARIVTIDLPNLKYGIALYFIINRAEAASNLYRYDGSLYGMRNTNATNLFDMYLNTRHDGFGTEVKRRILVGNYVLSAGHKDAYYTKAQHIRAMLRTEFESAFKNVDLLMSPTTSILPFKLGALADDPVAMYMADYFSVPNCIIGTPGISLPCGFSKNNFPIGMQFLGPRMSEALLYKVAHAFQVNTDYHLKTPSGYEH
jgi:aspartyl-tRNA(Asn)/glutamyl-tRNA(Gln) amidotransferase subunit A